MDAFKELTKLEGAAIITSIFVTLTCLGLLVYSAVTDSPWFVIQWTLVWFLITILVCSCAIYGILYKKPRFSLPFIYGLIGLFFCGIIVSIVTLVRNQNLQAYITYMYESILADVKPVPGEQVYKIISMIMVMYVVVPIFSIPILMAYYCNTRTHYIDPIAD
ncbi:hypothetical protein L596_022194 [Steinernema carpocapsae]|uniref:Transmembrane protein n=1 Tax=Steinernema carpocapsae TaxID=34508 RepID=A0A4U5ML29_STECR|nr:hypothetical protein L596_022194 [Steinernema carpocapsae]